MCLYEGKLARLLEITIMGYATGMVKALKPREKQRRANVRKFQHEKTKNVGSKLAHDVHYAKSALTEIKEIASTLRPFLTNGAILLGSNWDQIMEDQVSTALNGVIQRPVVDSKTGVPLTDDKGNILYKFVEVDVKEQLAVRKHLIDTFPKLIPEEAREQSVDPLVALARELSSGGGGSLSVQATVNSDHDDYEPDDNIIDGVARIISDNNATESAIDLSSENA